MPNTPRGTWKKMLITFVLTTSYWEKPAGAYVIRKGKQVLRGQATIMDAGILSEDVLELIPDPEGGR
jgi:hypothetical protein